MSVDREFFLAELARDEDNEPLRMAFADWLEERGEDDEADRQRQWTAAKSWIVRLCEECGSHSYYDPLTADRLIAMASEAVVDFEKDHGYGLMIYVGGYESMMEAVQERGPEFWRNWSIVTGIPIPSDSGGHCYYRCAC